MPTPSCSPRPRLVALDLAHHFIAAMHPNADAAEREHIESTILCAGQHLADAGSPGRWESLDPLSFLAAMPLTNDRDRLEVCFELVGLYGWLGSVELIAPQAAAEVLARVRQAIPDQSEVQSLCDTGLQMLAMLATLEELGDESEA